MIPVHFKKMYLLSSERYDSLLAQANLNRNEPQKILQSLRGNFDESSIENECKSYTNEKSKAIFTKTDIPQVNTEDIQMSLKNSVSGVTQITPQLAGVDKMCINICPNNKEKKSQLDRKRNYFNLSEDSPKESNENKKAKIFQDNISTKDTMKNVTPSPIHTKENQYPKTKDDGTSKLCNIHTHKHDNLIPSDLNGTTLKYYIMLSTILVYNRKITIRPVSYTHLTLPTNREV